jgi:hypothetical protein
MSAPPLVVLAAGMSSRYGRLKQVDPVGPGGESIMDYNVFDAARAGFSRAVFIVRPEIVDEVRRHVDEVVGRAFPVSFVQQTLDHLPPDLAPPPERVRPWGTGQAVLCAAAHVRGPFGVCNADDLYGPVAFEHLFSHLTADPLPTEAALVGYTLSDTLSTAGGVSRGMCLLGKDKHLQRITEVHEVRQVEGWIEGRLPDGDSVELEGDEIVSMNLWGFSDPVMDMLDRQFRRFMSRWGADTAAEFPLSTALGEQVHQGTVRVTVLPGGNEWFGVTHAGDRADAEETLRARVEEGRYPENLATAFAGDS